MTPKEALDLRFDEPQTNTEMTIREYFALLLRTLFHEGEGFSGKRPLGNSGWEYDLAIPLVKAGCIKGEIGPDPDYYDEDDGDVNFEDVPEAALDFDYREYDAFIKKMLKAL